MHKGIATTAAVTAATKLEDEIALLHDATFGWALACCGRDRTSAEDVLQDVYFKVLDGRARFSGQSSFKTWLFGVVRMTAREHRRWTVTRLFRFGGGGGGDGDGALEREAEEKVADTNQRAPDSSVAARQRAEELGRAFAKLAERQREVLHLVFYEDLSIAEAAGIMGVTLGTARQHYERGKHALSALLSKDAMQR